jgi:phosphoribosylanthranilate isomerase
VTAHSEPPSSESSKSETSKSVQSTAAPLRVASSSSPKIKICGICNIEDAQLAVKYKIDYMGLIFVKSSPRYIDPMIAKSIAAAVSENIQIVGVFQNSTLQEMENIASLVGLNYFQLHGQESPGLCSELSKPVIKAFQLASKITGKEDCITLPLLDLQSGIELPNAQSAFTPKVSASDHGPHTKAAAIENSLSILETYKAHCQYLLFDRPKTNVNHDWLKSASYALNLIEEHGQNYFLAGGLNANNIARALQTLKPAALDIASGVEKTARQKSETLIADFCAKVKEQYNEPVMSHDEP